MGVLSFRNAEQQQPHVLPERRPFHQVHFILFPIPTSTHVFARIREAAPVADAIIALAAVVVLLLPEIIPVLGPVAPVMPAFAI